MQRMAAAGRCVAVDPFAGVGGNVIQMALRCERVIAVDNSPERLEICRHNAQVRRALRRALQQALCRMGGAAGACSKAEGDPGLVW